MPIQTKTRISIDWTKECDQLVVWIFYQGNLVRPELSDSIFFGFNLTNAICQINVFALNRASSTVSKKALKLIDAPGLNNEVVSIHQGGHDHTEDGPAALKYFPTPQVLSTPLPVRGHTSGTVTDGFMIMLGLAELGVANNFHSFPPSFCANELVSV
ncbi:hypothetical protein TcasGA2_TC016164 [Tribolium castaneum]|uniref:Uncharacterized protein n=1 Tax=Tribolium castaneum TaxID=7070 RepID=D6WBG9_TRICA|nr:hypothetical protein TcasGA2_TC016164 [Tribolium castaneum]